MEKERIGLLGGTFNPIHEGHLRAAEEIRRRFGLDKILFIPSYIPPHKQTADMASPEDRFAMVKIAVEGRPHFIASPIEIEAQERSYSIITLNKVKNIYRDAWIFFILGIDAFLEIETWRSYQEVLEQCRFIVTSRPGYILDDASKVLPTNYAAKILDLGESKSVEEALILKYRIFLVAIKALDISSTEIRQRIKRGQSVKGFVPEAVEVYIKSKKIYQEQDGQSND
jgi:nicotinate-nucleotide adenylyltransferase